jgi:tyrosyl-tRNA synthetase
VDVPLEEVRETLRTAHPREAKERLARAIVGRYYGDEAARAAAEEFRRVYAKKQRPSEIPRVELSPEDLFRSLLSRALEDPESPKPRVGLAALLVYTKCASSNSDAMRKISQGAVGLDGKIITDPKYKVSLTESTIINVGKREWREIVYKPG